MENLLIIGAGGHGSVCKEIAERMQRFGKISFLDDKEKAAIGKCHEFEKYKDNYQSIFVAIGNNQLRANLIEKIEKSTITLVSLIDPTAFISKSGTVEKGCVIEANAVINTNAIIKKGTIISIGTLIDHDAIINECCHINSGAVVKAASFVPAGLKVDSGMVFREKLNSI